MLLGQIMINVGKHGWQYFILLKDLRVSYQINRSSQTISSFKFLCTAHFDGRPKLSFYSEFSHFCWVIKSSSQRYTAMRFLCEIKVLQDTKSKLEHNFHVVENYLFSETSFPVSKLSFCIFGFAPRRILIEFPARLKEQCCFYCHFIFKFQWKWMEGQSTLHIFDLSNFPIMGDPIYSTWLVLINFFHFYSAQCHSVMLIGIAKTASLQRPCYYFASLLWAPNW